MKIGEECGIFGGITFEKNIAPYIQQGLLMLQHRGQESAGICYGDNELRIFKDKGLVLEVLHDKVIKNFKGRTGIGHVRYSTQGRSDAINAQPYMIRYLNHDVAVAHNGNVKQAIKMKKELEKEGEVFITSSDTEMILKKIIKSLCKPPKEWVFCEVGDILEENFTGGAWSLLFGFPGRVMAFRDPLGCRPLFFCESKEGYFVSSEDSSFHLLSKLRVVELQPGEGVEITSSGYKIAKFANGRSPQQCVFEHIYFARPDSNIFGRNVYLSRVELGKRLAKENPVQADMVIPIMDSGFASAIGYSHESGIPLHMGLMRNHWVGRSFIQPDQRDRRKQVKTKLIPIEPVIRDKRVIVVDDSIVRGTTSKEIVRMLREAGAKEVHFRLASPRIINNCFWGVDIPTKEELIANTFKDIQGISDYLNLDSLGYLSIQSLKDQFGETDWCYNCFMGDNNNEISGCGC